MRLYVKTTRYVSEVEMMWSKNISEYNFTKMFTNSC